jgi:hypothetical protein
MRDNDQCGHYGCTINHEIDDSNAMLYDPYMDNGQTGPCDNCSLEDVWLLECDECGNWTCVTCREPYDMCCPHCTYLEDILMDRGESE